MPFLEMMLSFMRTTRLASLSRHTLIAICVLAFHGAALWAIQSGLLRRAVEVLVPADLIVEFLAPTAPKVVPQPPAPPKPRFIQQATPKAAAASTTETPLPLAVDDPTPSPHAPTGTMAKGIPAQKVTAEEAPQAPARLQLPSSDADYLQNPRPSYPSLSKRLGEQGKVVVRVLIDADGTAQKAEIKQSSGFDRLDQSALNTVLRWRYLPAKRAGVAQAMWFNVPISFLLE
jgi:protein TonB